MTMPLSPKLPRMSLAEAVLLGRALLLAASVAPRLPELVRLTRERLERRRDALARALGGRLPELHAPRLPEAHAEQRLELAWSALHSWLEALAGLSIRNQARKDAAALLDLLFPEGQGLVRPPPLLVWAESEARLTLLDREGFAAPICAAGGGPFLEAIAEAHHAFGQTLEGLEGGVFSSRRLSAVAEAFVLALHAYVAVVAAERAEGDPESAALASVLLAPLSFAALEDEPREAAGPSWEPLDGLSWDEAA